MKVTFLVGGRSTGRTQDSGSWNRGSNPCSPGGSKLIMGKRDGIVNFKEIGLKIFPSETDKHIIHKWITTNLGIKILALVTAFLLWFHVITERTYETTVTVPIQRINLGENLLITKAPPESVKVRVKGKGKELLRFRRSAKITLDFNEIELGWKRIDLKKEHIELPPESKITVSSYPSPRSFVMRVEEESQKMVKVIPTLNRGVKFEVIPNCIEISGSRSAVNAISKITTEEIALPQNLPTTLKVKLVIPTNIRVSVDSVTVILKSS